jgi:hypothetical protein
MLMARAEDPGSMSQSRKRKRAPKHLLALPDLEQSKAAVLNSLTSKSGIAKLRPRQH